MRLQHVAVAGLLLATIFSTSAIAQHTSRVPCGERTAIVGHLKDVYGEDFVAMGLDAQGRVIEVLAAPNGGTWTMLVSTPGGLTCLVGSGVAWEDLKAPEPEGPVS